MALARRRLDHMKARLGALTGAAMILAVAAGGYGAEGHETAHQSRPATLTYGNHTLVMVGRGGPDKAFMDRFRISHHAQVIVGDDRGLTRAPHTGSAAFPCQRVDRNTFLCDMPKNA